MADDDRPWKKRRDDDDDGGADDRRRRDDEDAFDDYDGEGDECHRRLPRETLRAIAGHQKALIFCILIYLCLIPTQFVLPDERLILIPLVLLGLTATVFVFLLATKVYSTAAGVILGVLTLVPCIGLIVLVIINQKAVAVLKRHGVRVGFLGARASDI